MNPAETVVVEISSSGILIHNEIEILVDSPSCALINSDYSIDIGRHALEQAHLRPLDVSTNYWEQLTQNSSTKYSVSNAEIAYKHLTLAWEQLNLQNAEVIIIVPNTFNKQDLGLLLGICNKLSISIFALLSNAVLALKHHVPECKVIHLDILQNIIVFNEIEQDETSVSAKQAKRILPYGLETLNGNIAKNIADKFVHETRYDPIHSVEEEQAFFNALPQWLAKLQQAGSIECILKSKLHTYKINLKKEDIIDANQLAFNEIALTLSALLPEESKNILIICSPNSGNVFNLTDFLNTLPGCAVKILDKASLSKRALLLKDTILSKQKQVLYTTSLNWHKNYENSKIIFNTKSLHHLDNIPTHILFNNIAYSLDQDTYINLIENTMNLSISKTHSNGVVCKIKNKGYIKEIIKLSSINLSINNKEMEKSYSISIGDNIKIENNKSEFKFIKVNRYET